MSINCGIRDNKIIIVKIAALVILVAVIFNAVFWGYLAAYRVILPISIKWNEETVDDNNLSIVLNNKEVNCEYNDVKIWKSDDGVKVSDMLYCDIDGDDVNEIILLCWKKGKYGKHKPLWVERDESLWSQHIYIYNYDLNKNAVVPKWMASDIGFEVCEWEYTEDNMLMLVDSKTKEVSFWRWSGWGLYRIK